MDAATTKWKFRPPPRGVAKENLRRCKVKAAEDCCQLGDLCDEAHSEQELEEWQVRWEEDHRYTIPLRPVLSARNVNILSYRDDQKKKTYSEKILDELLDAQCQR